MDQAIPWSRRCTRNPLSNEGILLPQHFPWIKSFVTHTVKGKSPVDQGFTRCFNFFIRVCIQNNNPRVHKNSIMGNVDNF